MRTRSRRDHRAGLLAGPMVAVALLASGCAAGSAHDPATTEATQSTAASSHATPTAAASAKTSHASKVLARSEPTSLNIPAIGAHSQLLSLGLKSNGSLEVPPTSPGSPAGWYNGSPTPGERGPAVLTGHVNDTDGGQGIFAEIKDLKPGDIVEITRRDETTAQFVVQRGEAYSKDDFPAQSVYGNTADAQLRLITCDGYNAATGLFDDNYVVYATLR